MASRWVNEGVWTPEEIVCRAIPEPHLSNLQNTPSRDVTDDVIFSDDYYRLFDRNGFAFPAAYRGQPIRFVVSCATLVKQYGAMSADVKSAEPTFLANLPKLQELAKTLILSGQNAQGEEIVIE